MGPRVLKWFLGMADGAGAGACLLLPTPNDKKFRKERKGVLPPLLGDDGLAAGVAMVGLPPTEGYRDGGTSPRWGDERLLGNLVCVARGLITGICEALCVSAMLFRRRE